MRFAYDFASLPVLLIAAACALGVGAFAVVLVMQSFARTRAIKRFGEPALVTKLESWDSGSRRSVKNVLLVLALVLAFVALARPQFRNGTRLIPATNLDVVIVLDYSKSMYARDIAPSRIAPISSPSWAVFDGTTSPAQSPGPSPSPRSRAAAAIVMRFSSA